MEYSVVNLDIWTSLKMPHLNGSELKEKGRERRREREKVRERAKGRES